MTKVRNVTKSIPGVSLLTNRLEQYRPTLKQETLDKLSSYMDKISKLAKSEKLA
jgi:hypothetical protein